jgi:CRISPR-associated protein Csb2
MPQSGEVKLMIHDAFVALDRSDRPDSRLSFLWREQTLTPDQEQLLDRLLLGLGYFGRAESWCEASRGTEPDLLPNAAPSQEAQQLEDTDGANLLCAEQSVTLEQLMVETSELQKKGYNRPPGSRWVSYQRPRTALHGQDPSPRPKTVKKHIAAFLLQARVLPKQTDTLLIADWARLGINGAYGRRNERTASTNFTGKSGGEMRRDQHRHVFFLPQTAATSDGLGHDRLDRLYIWAPDGFSPEELEVLKTIRTFPDLRRQSREKQYDDRDERERKEAERFHLVPLALLEDGEREKVFGRSHVWVSTTPYLCSRHPKRSGKDSPEDQIRRECRQRGIPEPISVTPFQPAKGSWLDYKRRRWRKDPPPGVPQGYRLEFAEAQTGPLSLGASSHFGMGRFEVCSDQ